MSAGAAVGEGERTTRFPIPLVGAVAILIVLIVFTPVLFDLGPPAPGTFETQGVLVVDQVAAGSDLTFYVHAEGNAVRYATIGIAVGLLASWSATCPATGVHWSAWANDTEVIEETLATALDPVAVRVSAVYTAAGASANYSAELAIDSSGGAVSLAACYGATPPSGAQPIASLPLVLLLTERSSGGVP